MRPVLLYTEHIKKIEENEGCNNKMDVIWS